LESASPRFRASRPASVVSGNRLSNGSGEQTSDILTPTSVPRSTSNYISTSTQTFTDSSTSTEQDTYSIQAPQPPKIEVISYEKSTQTEEEPWEPSTNDAGVGDDGYIGRETREENLEQLKQEWLKEQEEELKSKHENKPVSLPIRTLDGDELDAVVKSVDYLDFLDKSLKIADRALEEPYDILVDYSLDTGNVDEDDDFGGKGRTRKGRRVKQVLQFWHEKWSRKRMISDVAFSPKVIPPYSDETAC